MKIKNIIATLLVAFMCAGTADAATWYVNGLYVGNVCQTPIGWQFVRPSLVGAACYSPMWNAYGYIANE